MPTASYNKYTAAVEPMLEGVEKYYILSGISKDLALEALQKQYINAEKVVSYPLNNSVKSYPLG